MPISAEIRRDLLEERCAVEGRLWADIVRERLLLRLKNHEAALTLCASVLGSMNQNVINGDLCACVADLAQIVYGLQSP